MRVASVQCESINGDFQRNFEKAERVFKAGKRGNPHLVLFPELLGCGYHFSRELWKSSEEFQGKTLSWLGDFSRRHNTMAGTSFLEKKGNHYYNTFVLTDQKGGLLGQVRKQKSCWCEAHYIGEQRNSHIIETPLGRIGVSICFEGFRAFLLREMLANPPDILLMPHSSTMLVTGRWIKESHVNLYRQTLDSLPVVYAKRLSIPVIMANKRGPWHSPIPLSRPQESYFAGMSKIVDSRGEILASLTREEACITADLRLGKPRDGAHETLRAGHWAFPGPFSRNFTRLREWIGRIHYRMNPCRYLP